MKKFMNAPILGPLLVSALFSCSAEVKFSGGNKQSVDQKSSQVFNFQASEIVDGKMTLADGGRFASYEVRQSEKAPSRVIHQQVKRRKFSERFTQGHKSRFSQEEFQLSEAGMLDFLLVVDDSRSMADEQAIVARGLTPLISQFKDTNWQIAVVSMSNPCVTTSNLIKKSDLNPERKFENAVKMPYDPNATEQGFPMAIQALKGQCRGSVRPWVRDGSSIGVLFLSDEDNCGSNPHELERCKDTLGKNSQEMVSFLQSIRPDNDARMYGIVDTDGTCQDAAGIGKMYMEAAAATGGTVGSICHAYSPANGYGTYLESVSTDVNRIMKRQFILSAVPDMGQFDVAVDGAPIDATGAVKIQGKTIFIDPKLIKAGVTIKFSYTHDAVPMFSEIPVSATPVLSSVDLKVNGVALQPQKDFVYNPIKSVIEFTTQPPEDAAVTLAYDEDVEMRAKFAADFAGVRKETVKVLVNGLEAPPTDYTIDVDGIQMLKIPDGGSTIAIEWKNESHKNLKYPMKISDSREVVAWKVTQVDTGEEIPAVWNKTDLEFEANQVIDGRVLQLFVDFGEKPRNRKFELPSERLDDNVRVLADGAEGVCKPVESGQVLSLDQTPKDENPAWKSRYKGKHLEVECQEGADYKTLEVKYQQEINRTNVFEVKLPLTLDPDDKNLGWVVFIDGVRTKDFERRGREITIEEAKLPPGARVDVEVITYEKVIK